MRIPLLSALALSALLPALAAAQSYDPVMTRADFVRLVMEEHGIDEDGGGRCFTDVRDQEFADAVCAAKEEGLVTGDPSGRFRPYDHVTYVEAAAIVVRAEGERVRAGTPWYKPYVDTMEDWDAVPSSVKDIFKDITRSQGKAMIAGAADRDDDDNHDDDDGDIRLQVTAADARPEAGDRVTFRIRVSNLTDDDLDDVRVTAELDDDMDYVSSTEDGDEDDGEVEWEDLEIDDGETLTLLLNVEIDPDADEDDLLRLRVEGEGAVATVSVRVGEDDEADGDPELDSITISDSPDPVHPGDTVRYRIRLRNGDEDIDATVRAFLNDDMHFVEAEDDGQRSGDTIVWDGIELDADEERTLEFEVRIDDDVLDGQEILLRVEAAGEEDTETTEIDGEWDPGDEDVSVFISDSAEPVRRGDDLTYRITIENNEGQDIRVDARAFLDAAGTTYVSGSDGASLYASDEVHWNDLKIDEGDSKELLLTVRVGNVAPSLLYMLFEAGNDDETETTKVQ